MTTSPSALTGVTMTVLDHLPDDAVDVAADLAAELDTTTAGISKFEAAAHTEAARANLADAVAMIRTARQLDVAGVLGYPSHGAYLVDKFGDILADLRLDPDDVAGVVYAMRMVDPPAANVAIAKLLGLHPSTIRRYRLQLILGGQLNEPLPAARAAASDGVPARLLRRVEALYRLAQDRGGRTSAELHGDTGWATGTASGVLSRMDRRGLAARTGEVRGGRAVYELTALGADVLAAALAAPAE